MQDHSSPGPDKIRPQDQKNVGNEINVALNDDKFVVAAATDLTKTSK